jgi:hypothetical protein
VDCDGRVSALDALNPLRFASQLAVTQNESCSDIGTFVGWYWETWIAAAESIRPTV